MNSLRIISILILQLCCGCHTERLDNYRVSTQFYNEKPNVEYSTSSPMEENKTMSLEIVLPVSNSISNYSSNESSIETSYDSGIIETNNTLHLSNNSVMEDVTDIDLDEASSLASQNSTKNFKTNNVLIDQNDLTWKSTRYFNNEKTTQRMLLKSFHETSERTKITMKLIKIPSTWKSTSFPPKNLIHGHTSDESTQVPKSTHKNSISTKSRHFLNVIIHLSTSETQQHDKPNKYSNENLIPSSDWNANGIRYKNAEQRSMENQGIKLSKLATVQTITTNMILHKITNQLINRFPSSKSLHSTLSSRTVLQKTTQPNWKIRDSSLNSNMFEKVCDLDKDVGLGSDSFSSWYFNKKSGKCEWFSYRGEGGNGNRFYHRANCENSCIDKHENICLKAEIVICVQRWFNCKIESDFSCKHFAKMNELNESLLCPPKQPICINEKLNIRQSPVFRTHLSLIPMDCFLPKDSGTCNQDSSSPLVYYYDPIINDCLGFLFSRCGGNFNRFFSKPDCMNRCAI